MTDSPMIQVLKYLEAGKRIYRRYQSIDPIVYRYNPDQRKQCVEWCDLCDVGTPEEHWVKVTSIGPLADLLPFIPQEPALPQPTPHIRRVEL